MNIYLVKRTDDIGYNQYRSMVVVASTADDARGMVPDTEAAEAAKSTRWAGLDRGWGEYAEVDPATLDVTLVGLAAVSTQCVLLASFDAG